MAKPRTHDKKTSNIAFSEAYKDACRKSWYMAGRPAGKLNLEKCIPEDELGRKASTHVIVAWRREQTWDVWADMLDARAEAIVDDQLVNERVLMLKRQASIGKEIQEQAIEYLREEGFDTSASAVNAITRGAELERTSRGISERLLNLLKLSDDELTREAVQLLNRGNDSGEIIDIPEENIEDAED